MPNEIEQGPSARHAFDQQTRLLRPDLHRFCTRMTGSVSEGEDAVQDALVHAFYHLPELREGASLRSWLFRIAHNLCIDRLRRRKVFLLLDEQMPLLDGEREGDTLEHRQLAEQTLAAIFTQLPPKERAAIVLKDVLGYSLEESAEITDSNVGAIKAAVHRARHKLARAAPRPMSLSEEERALIESYVARFNSRDWDGVRALLSHDARLEVVQRTEGPFVGPYFQNYASLPWQWRLELRVVEGSPMVVHFRRLNSEAAEVSESGAWVPHSVIAFGVRSGRVSLVRDYVHIDYLLHGAHVAPGVALSHAG